MNAVEICTDFTVFNKAVHNRFLELSNRELYVTDIGDELYDKYLSWFPAEANPIFRQRHLYDCQTCKQFIRRLGKLVSIQNGNVITMWGDLDLPEPFKTVADNLDSILKSSNIVHVFRTKERQFGVEYNYDPKTNERYDHFWGVVNSRHYTTNPDTERSEKDAIFQVMKRGLTEIKAADLDIVIDLIDSNSLYRGEEHKLAVQGFMDLLKSYKNAGSTDLFIWENLENRNSRFRNTVIGTLLTDLADGRDLEYAVKSFESKVAPMNYKRPTAIITQKMVEDAIQTLTNLGLHGAISRRFAKLSDVSVNDVLFVDNDTKGQMKDGVAALLNDSIKRSTPNLSRATKITSDEFIKTILPEAKTLEVLVENRHQGNFVSLTGADGPERLFKWDNNFAWSYDGDATDSIKQRVKAAGGNIMAKLRVSLSWFNLDDLDLHARTPNGCTINYANKSDTYHNVDVLDVDMNAGVGRSRSPVENMAFNNLRDGVYSIHVNQFCRRETIDVGFAIEVEFDGVIHQYSYPKPLKVKENVQCFKLHIKNGRLEKIETELAGGTFSQDKWGVKTETLVPVAAVMFSPNYWGANKVGSKHLIFVLKGCKNPGFVRGIYNEFLRSDLEKHRKVFEVLGSKTKCHPSDEQMSGVGFTAARNDTVTVLVDGRRPFILTF